MVTEEIEIEAPQSIVYSIVSNFAEYPEFVPGVKSTKVKQNGQSLEVVFTVNIIKEISYTIRAQLSEPNGLTWEFVDGELMRSNSGAWELSSVGGKTHAKYSVDVTFGWLVPKSIVDQLTKTQLPIMLKAFKERAEKKAAIA